MASGNLQPRGNGRVELFCNRKEPGLKIALIRRKYTPYGGAERYVENLSLRLVEKGYEVHVFSHSWPGSKGISVHPVAMLPGMGLLKLWSFNFGVHRLLAKESFDVVQSFEKTWCQDVYRAGEGCHREWLLQRKKYESFYKTIGVSVNPFHWLTLAMERKLFEKSDTRYFIANSQRGKKEILSHYKVPEKKIKVIYNAVPFSLPPPLPKEVGGKAKHEKTLLFVGSGFQRKGLYFVIKAFPQMAKETDIRLVVVGKGNQKKAEHLAERLGVRGKIFFAGPVKEIAPFYRQADVFVLPSIYEPFSNACLEAMAFGLPIITTEMNGASEVIIPGKNGGVIKDPADIIALSEAISQALRLEKTEVRKTQETILPNFSWEQHLKNITGLYQEVFLEKKSG